VYVITKTSILNMSESNTTVNTELSDDGPLISLRLTENDLYMIGGLVLFFILVLLIMCKFLRKGRKKRLTKTAPVGSELI
jgi:hypothetical protein